MTLAARAEGDSVVLSVQDAGPGFGDVLERAFERFSRGRSGRTGLGLAIVGLPAGGDMVPYQGPSFTAQLPPWRR